MRIISSKEFRGEILDRLVNRGKADLSTVSMAVRTIIADVRENGDVALLRYTEKFDNVHLIRSKLKVCWLVWPGAMVLKFNVASTISELSKILSGDSKARASKLPLKAVPALVIVVLRLAWLAPASKAKPVGQLKSLT